jgi:FAD/FMN-containing dehydrogenase
LVSLIAELPEGTVVTDPDILESYRQDRAVDPGAGTPLAVLRPRRTEDVQIALRWATANKIAVVPRGMGTGLCGGATALTGGIVLTTEKMRDVSVDPVNPHRRRATGTARWSSTAGSNRRSTRMESSTRARRSSEPRGRTLRTEYRFVRGY